MTSQNLSKKTFKRGQILSTLSGLPLLFLVPGYVLLTSLGLCTAQVQGNNSLNILLFEEDSDIRAHETVIQLVNLGHQVALVNVDQWYWDSAKRVKPLVKHFVCNRRLPPVDYEKQCPELANFVKTNKTDVVVDFGSVQPYDIENILELLQDKPKVYIFVSTAMVYETIRKNHTGPTLESDAYRPDSLLDENLPTYLMKDEFADIKLLAEEYLIRQKEEEGGPPFIILRLPDVIGPRDLKSWIFHLWLKLEEILNPGVPRSWENKTMSLVYVKDVANLIGQLVTPKPEALDKIYNIAHAETPTLLDYFIEIKRGLNYQNLSVPVRNDSAFGTDIVVFDLFRPSRHGPLDITKATDTLGWSPTPLTDALKETVDYFEQAFNDSEVTCAADLVVGYWTKPYCVPDEARKKVVEVLKDFYNVDYSKELQ